MKKKLLLMPLLMFAMTSCVMYNGQGKPGASKNSQAPLESITSTPSGESQVTPSSQPAAPSSQNPTSNAATNDELPVGTAVKVYLVFGPHGLYKGNAVDTKIAALFLEHAMELEAKVGDELPGKDDVTSNVTDSKFITWTAYNNDGKLTEYLKVPGQQNKILYASFSGGNGGGSSGHSGGGGQIDPPTPGEYSPSTTGALPTTGYGFKFSDGSYMDAVRVENSDEGHEQYLIKHRKFVKDQVFQLCDFGSGATWTVDLDPYSFNGNSDMSTAWMSYILRDTSDPANMKYIALQDFNVESIYIKLKYGEDEVYFQLGE